MKLVPPEPQSYTIGWICAHDTEYVAARAFLDKSHWRMDDIDIRDANDYTLGQMGLHNIVIAVLPHWQHGLVNAAAAAKDMARTSSNLSSLRDMESKTPSRKYSRSFPIFASPSRLRILGSICGESDRRTSNDDVARLGSLPLTAEPTQLPDG